ncbi:MAG: endo-1,4-beta-xylanase [Bacteroidales bacterium]|nr:endo-1,4-beta-xylanase [Candidatus Scybalocola fimicaballi]
MKKILATSAFALLFLGQAQAQLAKDNKCKFLGNITTSYNWQEYCDVSDCNLVYSDYWDQVTCENATKWGSVHSGWGKFNWTNADRTYNYCKQKGIIFKYHALIWGSQHPAWIENLSVADTKKAIVEWYDEVKKHYPDLKIIDVVNEAIYSGGNYHSPYKQTKIIEALGSLAEDRAQKETGTRPSYNCNTNGYPNTNSYQWLAEAFRLARERWPNATLIYNDYNTFQWQKNEFIALVNGIKACGGPIDAAGNQAHDLNDMSGSDFKTALYDIYNKTKLPQYITEYDINKKNDATFETRYKEQFPIMWEADFVPGVTLWGWIYGKTWVNDGGDNGASGLVRNCQDRSAFTWLKSYMKTSAAKNASASVCGKNAGGASLTVESAEDVIALGDSVKITAAMSGAKHIEFKTGGELIVDKWVLDPCVFYFKPTQVGEYKIDATGYNDKNETAKASLTVKVIEVGPYGGKAAVIPGKIEAENYDNGFAGKAYNDLSDGNVCDDFTDYYRSDDVDIKKITNGVALGHCQKGEWLNYTVNVAEEGDYEITVRVGEGNEDGGQLTIFAGNYEKTAVIEQTGAWGTFDEVKIGTIHLFKGEQVIKLSIDKDWIDVDWISFQKDPTSVSDFANNNVISVIPNPASTKIEILGAGNDVKVEFVSLAGSVVKVSNETEISLSDVASGVYMLRITTPTETSVKKLVVKK